MGTGTLREVLFGTGAVEYEVQLVLATFVSIAVPYGVLRSSEERPTMEPTGSSPVMISTTL